MSSNENNDSWLTNPKEAVFGGLSGLLAGISGFFEWIFGLLTSPIPTDAIIGAVWANVPTLFTIVSVAQSEFQGFLLGFVSRQALTALSIGSGVLFMLYLGDRFSDNVRNRLKRK